MLKLVTFGHLYPDATRPTFGVFVETRLRRLLAEGGVASRVVSPAPWFPGCGLLGLMDRWPTPPARETRFGVEIERPRWLTIPRVGMRLQPSLMAAAARPTLRRLRAEGYAFDLIDAQYFYPDGVAAMRLAREFGVPFTVTARGTDLNLVPNDPWAKARIVEAAHASAANICVAKALKDVLDGFGVPPDKTVVLRNGVDLELFRPLDPATERARLGFRRPTLLSVGHLVERKGHHVLIEALPRLPDFDAAIVGSGVEEARLRALAARLGVADRVRFAGRVVQNDLAAWYSAAAALVLASDREGWANVLLEAMACGTPCVATAIWGTPEVVAAPEAGKLFRERTPAALAAAVRDLFAAPPDRAATRRYAEGFSWDATAKGLKALFADVVAGRARPAAARAAAPVTGS
ncbi:MAG TPA: glycosyltransferase [Planctomycetota bacterium]|nr:glycosyltransferase [Planctomycetota bacterium]